MANTFKNYIQTGVTTETTVMTVPVATTTTIIGMTVANTSGASTTVTVKVNGASLVKDGDVSPGTTMVPVGGDQKVVVQAGQIVTVTATNSVDVIISVLEQA